MQLLFCGTIFGKQFTKNLDECVHVRNNRIHAQKEAGISVDASSPLIENNEIFDNADDGIEVVGKAHPTIQQNSIHDNKDCGISSF